MKHVPNTLTTLRMLVTPAVLFLLFSDSFAPRAWAAALFILASISDWADGHMARKYGVGSRLGQFLDPVADKVLVLGTFAALCVLRDDLVPWWAVLLIAGRDLFVTLFRIWHNRGGRVIKTKSSAKWKTTFQLTFLIAVLLLWAAILLPGAVGSYAKQILNSVGITLLLYVTVAVTVATGFAYAMNPEFDTSHD
ncbi:MAG: CDP-diacylglycerol--glycerol-3-phosphate 3-phosphatidyltransferase [Rhodothermales bacterium]|nr:CDP-diacylglycerol--glycerol-3-phosphate 3-phosphatidyltransferase [Rhodothermales bacterium]MBO6779890.1 CDP-diacylglycerol--glycerol-3-phosphate 3-phosphatidyltransferase [Rhodothermales bacterium]